MQRTLAITTLILAAGFGAAHADIWRWKDAEGVFHYSDQWVPGSELIKSTRGARAPGEDDAAHPTQNKPLADAVANADKTVQQQAARTVQADVAKAREQQCKEAKERYEKAIIARRIYKQSKNGEKEYVSEDEANAYRLQAKNDVDQACGTAAK